jgi:hypothetical protein
MPCGVEVTESSTNKQHHLSKFDADTTRTSFITVPEPEQVKIMIGMQLQGSISSIYVMQTEIEIFKVELCDDTTRMDLKPPGQTLFITVPEPALQDYEDSKFGDDTTRTSFITVPEPEQVKIMICMQLQGSISSMNVMQTEIEIFKAELASHDNLWLSQSTTASIAVVEELSSEDAAEFEERVTTRKAKRAKQLLESASKSPYFALLGPHSHSSPDPCPSKLTCRSSGNQG